MSWPTRHIALAGVEMEGGWAVRPDIMKGDGSVTVGAQHVGECATPPVTPVKVPALIKKYYPDYINSSCGYHIHISTKKPEGYSTLMQDAYNVYFLAEMEKFGESLKVNKDHFFHRLAGRNTYCRKQFDPLGQWSGRGVTSRYTQLNFCAYRAHKTLECRLFPMFSDHEVGIEAFKTFVSLTDDFIASHIAEEAEVIELNETLDDQEELLVA